MSRSQTPASCPTCGEDSIYRWSDSDNNDYRGWACKCGTARVTDVPYVHTILGVIDRFVDFFPDEIKAAFIVTTVLFFVITAICFFAGEGRVQYCYVKRGNPIVTKIPGLPSGTESETLCLMGHSDYHNDRIIQCGIVDPNQIVTLAKTIHCPLEGGDK